MTNYNYSTTFGNLAPGNQPLSNFDVNFDSAARMGTLMCSAVGTNTITLSSLTNYPTMTAYGNTQKIGFIPQNTTTSLTSILISSLAVLNAYDNDGVTQIGSSSYNQLTAGRYYEFVYNSTLNSSSGGWQRVSPMGVAEINVQIFTNSGTYTPTPGMLAVTFECWGGGGGGGGIAGGSGSFGGGGGGGAGSYSRKSVFAATVGSSQVVTVGSGGAGGVSGNHAGTSGSATSVGSICVANGGGGGGGSAGTIGGGGAGGSAGTGDIAGVGQYGGNAIGGAITTLAGCGGIGGSTAIGAGGLASFTLSSVAAGGNGLGYGSGGSGGSANGTVSTTTGGNGAPGIVYITEYIGG